MQSLSTKYRLHIDLKINLHIFYKIVDTVLLQTCDMEIFCDCIYVAVAAKTISLEYLRYSESTFDLQQYLMCKEK